MDMRNATAEQAYPEKVLSIYRAVIHFFCTGRDLGAVKITDIAREAGIGKGTVYEYFGSKEEVILKAVLYAVEVIVKKIFVIAQSGGSFKERLFGIMDYLLNNSIERIALARALTQYSISADLKSLLRGECEKLERMRADYRDLIQKLLEDGRKEGVITSIPNEFYGQMVAYGAMSGLMNEAMPLKTSDETMSNQEIMDNVYRMIVRALNE